MCLIIFITQDAKTIRTSPPAIENNEIIKPLIVSSTDCCGDLQRYVWSISRSKNLYDLKINLHDCATAFKRKTIIRDQYRLQLCQKMS